MTDLAERAVDAVSEVFGRHPGFRAVHAKGTVCKGTFTATPEAARLTRAAHMQGGAIPVTTRFSNGSGDPRAPDRHRDARGMATKFYLPDGSRTDMVALSMPCFFARTPEDFIAFTRAGKPLPVIGQPGPALGLYLLRHREALPGLRAFLGLKPPASYATCRFNGIHAFQWLDAQGGSRFIRYSWLPEAGEESLSGRAGDDYLQEDIAARLARGSARFALEVQLAADGDPTDDPTAQWPDSRERVIVGHLELTAMDTEREQGDDVLVFDPTRVTDGIELSGDRILRFRSPAYSVSIERRSGIPRPPSA